MLWKFPKKALLSALFAAGGCVADTGDAGPLVEPPLSEGKADVGDRVVDRGPLSFGADAAPRGSITEDLEFHGYMLSVRPASRVSLEVTQLGSSRTIDTTLFVYGPRKAEGGFGSASIAFDDDAGWGKLSKLSNLTLEEGGTYLVVVGTRDARGRGSYRLEASCASGECAPVEPVTPGACHPVLKAAIDACINDYLENDPEWFYSTTRRDIVEGCADAEPVAPAYDAHCASPAADALCDRSLEDLSSRELPSCRTQIWNETLDGLCVFGERYRDLFLPGAFAILGRAEIRAGSAVSTLERTQLLTAVRSASYEPSTYEEALENVDENVVFQTRLWDKSNHREFIAYEFGAGDNSYGLIFEGGTTNVASRINDGDLLGCTVMWGKEARECTQDADCADGLTCVGIPSELSIGRCLARHETHPATDSACSAAAPCPAGSGLVCQGGTSGDEGLCRPAWQQSAFYTEPSQTIAATAAGGEAQLLAYGLATVPTDIQIDVLISHPDIRNLRVTLVNPSGTEVPVFSGERAGQELYLSNHALRVFPSDESANGVWRLRAVDVGSRRSRGSIDRFGLRITSRWD